MNSLSWLLYAADVVPSLGSLFVAFAFVTGAVAMCCTLGWFINADMADFSRSSAAMAPLFRKYALRIWPVVPLFAFLAVVVPSRSTILTIAASEMGEKVYATPAAQEVMRDLQDAVKAQLKRLKEAGR